MFCCRRGLKGSSFPFPGRFWWFPPPSRYRYFYFFSLVLSGMRPRLRCASSNRYDDLMAIRKLRNGSAGKMGLFENLRLFGQCSFPRRGLSSEDWRPIRFLFGAGEWAISLGASGRMVRYYDGHLALDFAGFAPSLAMGIKPHPFRLVISGFLFPVVIEGFFLYFYCAARTLAQFAGTRRFPLRASRTSFYAARTSHTSLLIGFRKPLTLPHRLMGGTDDLHI